MRIKRGVCVHVNGYVCAVVSVVLESEVHLFESSYVEWMFDPRLKGGGTLIVTPNQHFCQPYMKMRACVRACDAGEQVCGRAVMQPSVVHLLRLLFPGRGGGLMTGSLAGVATAWGFERGLARP